LEEGETVTYEANPERGIWLQIARGAVTLNGEILYAGDGVAITGESSLILLGSADRSEVLLFDLV
jgi:hypothetical protein